MKCLFTLFRKVLLAVPTLFIIFSMINPIHAQIDFGKIKKAGESLKKGTEATECEPLEKLKKRIELIKDDLNANNFSMLKMHFSYGKEFVQEVKSKCPGTDVTPYETELADLEKRWNTQQSNTETAAANQEQAENQMKEAARSVEFILYLSNYHSGMYAKKEDAQKFFEQCQKVDFANTKPKIEKLAEQYPDFKKEGREMNSYYKQFTVEFPKKCNEMISSFFIQEINKNIEEAYQLKTKGKSAAGGALEAAEAALLLSDGLLLLTPGHVDIVRLQKESKAAVDKFSSEFGAAVFTSNFHKENAGKIIFSKSRMTIKQEDPSVVSNKYSAGDYIYAMIYMNGTFTELTQQMYSVRLIIEVDGNEKANRDFTIKNEDQENTYLRIEISPEPTTAETQGAEIYSKALSELSPRFHKVSVIFKSTGISTDILAQGEFELDCTSGLDKLAAIAQQLRSIRLSKVRMPNAAMRDAKLEQEMITASDHPVDKPIRAVITGTEWTVHRHPISGAIEYRTIPAAVATKKTDGTCKIFYLTFKQDYNGKTYGKTQSHAVGDSDEIPCENVNK